MSRLYGTFDFTGCQRFNRFTSNDAKTHQQCPYFFTSSSINIDFVLMAIFFEHGQIERRVNFSFFIHVSDLLSGKTHKSILLRETFLHLFLGGRGGYTRTFANVRDNCFFKQQNYRKNVVSKKEYYS